jgi:hypothetical protein
MIIFIFILLAVFIAAWGTILFHGGFHFGAFKTLEKAKLFNDFIERQHDPELLREWQRFLKLASVENNKASLVEWLQFHLNRK